MEENKPIGDETDHLERNLNEFKWFSAKGYRQTSIDVPIELHKLKQKHGLKWSQIVYCGFKHLLGKSETREIINQQEDKIRRLTTRLDEQFRRTWALETENKKIIEELGVWKNKKHKKQA